MSEEQIETWKQRFESALPRIETHARIYFRDWRRDPQKFDEVIEETRAMAWKAYLRECIRGNNPDEYISAIARYSVKQVLSGRSVTGQEKVKDVLSRRAQRHKGFTVKSLTAHNCDGKVIVDGLADNHNASPADQAAFMVDTPEWLKRLGSKRPIIEGMMMGDSTQELAQKFKRSPGRISQMRSEANEDYLEFTGEPRRR